MLIKPSTPHAVYVNLSNTANKKSNHPADSVYFSGHRERLEKAEQRYHRIATNPRSSTKAKEDAYRYWQEVKATAKQAEKYQHNAEKGFKWIQKGAVFAAAEGLNACGLEGLKDKLGLDNIDEDKFEKGFTHVANAVGGFFGDKVAAGKRKKITEEMTDREFGSYHYPSARYENRLKIYENRKKLYGQDGEKLELYDSSGDECEPVQDRTHGFDLRNAITMRKKKDSK
jgi:hypothetical protein